MMKNFIEKVKEYFSKEHLQEMFKKENIKEYWTTQRIVKVLVYTFIVFFAILILIPFYWMILTSLKSMDQIQNEIPPSIFIGFREMRFGNYILALQAAPYLRYMVNTVVVASLSTIGTLTTTILAAFAFSRLNFKGRDILFVVLISTMMIPGEMYVITNFITVSDTFGWYSVNSQTTQQALLALTMPFMTSVFYMFFLRQTFRQIPDELYLAAKVDGTSDFKYLRRVMIPMAAPTIITITILNMMGTWSAYIWPNLVTKNPLNRLVTNGLRNAYTQNQGISFNEQMAAAMIVTLPLLITFLFLKKYIMRGVSRSGIKG